jgi:hypothetical protein|tara:strand:- start:20941 stop:21084 length:144 start_codon:yes stop_codon:yes gene_type:complete
MVGEKRQQGDRRADEQQKKKEQEKGGEGRQEDRSAEALKCVFEYRNW